MAKAERKRHKRFGTPSSSPDHAGIVVDERTNRERHARFGDGSVQGGRTMTQEVGAADLVTLPVAVELQWQCCVP